MKRAVLFLAVVVVLHAPIVAAARNDLAAPLTLYVCTTGSDANDCLTTVTACRTKQRASDLLQSNYDLRGQPVVVQSCHGVYTDPLSVMGPYPGAKGPRSVTFRGDTDAPYNNVVQTVTNANAFTASFGAQYTIEGFRIAATGDGMHSGHGLVADDGRIHFGIVDFADCSGAHIDAGPGGMIQSGANAWGYLISAGANIHAIAETGGTVALNGITIVIQYHGVAFATAGFQVDETGRIILYGSSFAGYGFTGKRFNTISNGVISSGQADTWIPGTSIGERSLGGVYY